MGKQRIQDFLSLGETAASASILFLLLAVQCTVECGASAPKVSLSRPIQEEELVEHVSHLAHPKLKGRKPLSRGSRRARKYIENHFTRFGLRPWGETKKYSQPIVIGTNMVGVLPGSDARVSDEIVLVSAHYDHLGGKHLGAADNASGVAAMLEIAERFSMEGRRPRHPICFAAFDCEERGLFGAFAFTCREDFEPSKIAAAVNLDILGRHFLDLMEKTVFLTGTESYPQLRREVMNSSSDKQIRILPIGTDVVGPRGNHVAFEAFGFPCLFFTNGLYGDYHEEGDTAEKLEYGELQRSADIAYETIRYLANVEVPPKATVPRDGDREELHSIETVLSTVLENEEKVSFSEEQKTLGHSVLARVNQLSTGASYSQRDRGNLIREGMEVFEPILYASSLDSLAGEQKRNKEESEKAAFMWETMREVIYSYRTALTEAYRDFVKETLQRGRVGLVIRGAPKFEFTRDDFTEDEVRISRLGKDRYRLSVLLPTLSLEAEFKGFLRWSQGSATMSRSFKAFDVKGTKNDLVDFCLLRWRWKPDDEKLSAVWRKVLRATTGDEDDRALEKWWRESLERNGAGDEGTWALKQLTGNNPYLVLEALRVYGNKETVDRTTLDRLSSSVYADRENHSALRGQALRAYGSRNDKQSLLNLVGLLDDETPYENLFALLVFDETYPFKDHPALRFFSRVHKQEDIFPKQTLGEVAGDRLRRLTGEDFGKDGTAWRKWVAKNTD
jgi:peptidase M28-like protein